jgi:hypothetical protein
LNQTFLQLIFNNCVQMHNIIRVSWHLSAKSVPTDLAGKAYPAEKKPQILNKFL